MQKMNLNCRQLSLLLVTQLMCMRFKKKHLNQHNPLQKELDRFLRKAGKGVEGDELNKVSPNALISFVCFVAYIRNKSIREIVAKNHQPSRYYAKLQKIERKYGK